MASNNLPYYDELYAIKEEEDECEGGGIEGRDPVRGARAGAVDRGLAANKLLGASGRLKDALRMHAELAKAIREKEEEKAKKSSFSWLKRGKKRQKVKKKSYGSTDESTRPLIPSAPDVEDMEYGQVEDEDIDDPEEHKALHSPKNNVSAEHEQLMNRLYDRSASTEDFTREVIQSDVDLDLLLSDMYDRAQLVQQQTDVLFLKAPTAEAQRNARLKRLCVIVIVAVLVTGGCLTFMIVLAVKTWHTRP